MDVDCRDDCALLLCGTGRGGRCEAETGGGSVALAPRASDGSASPSTRKSRGRSVYLREYRGDQCTCLGPARPARDQLALARGNWSAGSPSAAVGRVFLHGKEIVRLYYVRVGKCGWELDGASATERRGQDRARSDSGCLEQEGAGRLQRCPNGAFRASKKR